MTVSKRPRQRTFLPLSSESEHRLPQPPTVAEVRALIQQIVSGGQTGVDRAALDAAIVLGIPHGGWCPQGRSAEDGRIPDHYQLRECVERDYRVRTEKNVLDSDGTLILYCGALSGGTRLTRQFARQHSKPYLVVKLDIPERMDLVRHWLVDHNIQQLNVAGPRESSRPGIRADAQAFLERLFQVSP